MFSKNVAWKGILINKSFTRSRVANILKSKILNKGGFGYLTPFRYFHGGFTQDRGQLKESVKLFSRQKLSSLVGFLKETTHVAGRVLTTIAEVKLVVFWEQCANEIGKHELRKKATSGKRFFLPTNKQKSSFYY